MVEQVEELRSELDSQLLSDLGSLEAGGVKPLAKVVAAGFLGASGNNIWPNVGDPEVCRFQRSRPGEADLQREAALEGRDAVDAPTGNHAVRQSAHARQELLAVAEGKVEHVADDQALRNVLRRERAFSLQVVPVLYARNATGWSFEPAGECIGVAQEFCVGVSDQQRTAALEPARHGSLQRVVRAAAAAVAGER